jgi:Holliday junction DNA helicase RuvA
MISRLQGTVLSRGPDRVEIETSGGVVYEVEVPLTVLQEVPPVGERVELRTQQIVTDSSVALYGFVSPSERTLFQRLLKVNGVGAKVALGALSTYPAARLAKAIIEKDTVALRQVPKVGKKLAETIVLELSDKVDDLVGPTISDGGAPTGVAQQAVQALVSLGYSFNEADRAVRDVLETGAPDTAEELIRRALAGRAARFSG